MADGNPTPPPPGGPSNPKPPSGPRAGELLPVSEVAARWRCSRDHIYGLIAAGELAAVDIGTGRAKTRIPESELLAFERRHKRRARRAA